MAEFAEVMRQAKRMCAAHEACYKCPLKDHTAMCAGNKNLSCIASKCDVSELERIVMEWAAAHPEPRYPSWNEAWKQLMPNAHNEKSPCPCFFLDTDRAMKLCNEQECVACKNTPIPADIAEKLGIKPIGGSAE